jgi:outer membrane receptor for monomeric catechols
LNSIGGHSVFSTVNLSGAALEGMKIWHSINEYSELTENYRFKNDTSSTLQDFLRGAREGIVDNKLLHEMNKRIVLSRTEAIRQAHPSAVWIAHTKDSVAKFNKEDFKEKVEAGLEHFRIVATHSSATTIHPSPGQDERQILYQTMKLNGPPKHIDLAIGTRVSCVQNLGTQIGKNQRKLFF